MKKFILGFISGALIFSVVGAFAASYVADVAGFKVLVNGKEFVSDPPALVVEGRTYLPLRAMGDALGVPVNWNEELGQAEVGITPTSNDNHAEAKPDYEDVVAFEKALNNGEDLTGKTVVITVNELVPDSAFGYNIQTGEHLNFCSPDNPGIKKGDTITVKVENVTSMLGSYIIGYEMVK